VDILGRRDRDEGKLIAKQLWPELTLTKDGSPEDRRGIDGYLNNNKVQIKYNHRIVYSGNLYHEIYEKTANRPDQDWRKSPAEADVYIFITELKDNYTGYLVTLNELASKEIGKTLRGISPNNGALTSIGFLLKLGAISKETRKLNKPKLL
jgi:hypothetical protein